MLENLTMRQLMRFEEAARITIGEMADPAKAGARPLVALAWVIREADDPSFTWDDACSLTMDEVNRIIAGKESPDPFVPPTTNG